MDASSSYSSSFQPSVETRGRDVGGSRGEKDETASSFSPDNLDRRADLNGEAPRTANEPLSAATTSAKSSKTGSNGHETDEAVSNSAVEGSPGEETRPPRTAHQNDTNVDDDDEDDTTTIFPTRGLAVRLARHMARRPRWYGALTALITMICSIYGLVYAGFSITADMKGWWSRGTLMARQQTQIMILTRNEYLLQPNYNDDGNSNEDAWKELMSVVQPGIDNYLSGDDGDDDRRRRRRGRQRNRKLQQQQQQQSQQQQRQLFFYGPSECYSYNADYASWYSGGDFFYQDDNLWPVWRTIDKDVSAVSAPVIRDICLAEEATQQYLEENGFCGGCGTDGTQCLPPFSLVFMARLAVYDYAFALSCHDLADQFAPIQANITLQLLSCVADIRKAVISALQSPEIPPSCPLGFSPFMVDEQFGQNNNAIVRITSSVFSTGLSNQRNIGQLYESANQLDTAATSSSSSNNHPAVVTGVYDTRSEHFYDLAVDEAIQQDMVLAVIAVIVTVIAMIIHTKSPWITLAGLVNILISFPVTYFIYKVVLQIEFFPFLNFLGVYVIFAIGADDVFVACDKWKNVRLKHPQATTEQIASLALPDAAIAMFLTSSTTSVAFFGTAICPVPALKLFSIFLGLLVFLVYVLCLLFVFPALCLYDQWKIKAGGEGNPSRFVECCQRQVVQQQQPLQQRNDDDFANVDDEKRSSLIRRILSTYYDLLHFLRYPLLIAIGATFAASVVFSTRLGLPNTSDVRLLAPDSALELVFQWRLQLFGNEMLRSIGAAVQVVWGLTPSDTGNHNNPDESSVLVLDESFNPAPEENQLYLLNFCNNLFANNGFVNLDFETFVCPMTLFDAWLQEQAENRRINMTASDQYMQNCGNSTGVPVDASVFHPCFVHFKEAIWASDNFSARKSLEGVLSRSGIVRIMRIPFKQSGVRWDIGYKALNVAWKKLNKVMTEQRATAPKGVENVFASSFDYWWYDTNGSLLSTAIGGVFVALGAACVVLLWSTRSLVITTFGVVTIAYILVSVTAMLVASGWTMGFLEAVCFAILIGLSCDFVLHFSHAYCAQTGPTRREERTKQALIFMGPSILAAAITTIAAAIVLLFANVVFFQRFASILLYSLVMGLFGSLTVFLVLTDIFGPAEPTAFADYLSGAVFGKEESSPALQMDLSKHSAAETHRGKFIGHGISYA